MHEGKRVCNVLYTLCNKSSECNVTSHLVHVTKLQTMKSRGTFHDFNDGFYSNAYSI